MNIIVLTIFPDVFKNFLTTSIIKNAIKKKTIKIRIVDFRTFSTEKHKKVDDYQYGGGPGMVLALQPIVAAIKKYKKKNSHIVLLSPQGTTFVQQKAQQLAKYEDLILIAGHYEGFDERISNYVDEIISIGDYILTGGEIPAMVIIEATTRLIDKSINKDSLECETFDNNLLDYPIYTKPINFQGYGVPDVLLSGNHSKIAG
jgi:tRNA (guanine37-N1)-methyltransferase